MRAKQELESELEIWGLIMKREKELSKEGTE